MSRITDFNHLFMEGNSANFNSPIGNWQTGQVTDMTGCFDESFNFNQDISRWDVSNVRSFYQMFQFANRFNQDISRWDIDSGVSFEEMFDVDTATGAPGDGTQNGGNAMSIANKCAIGTAWASYPRFIGIFRWNRYCPGFVEPPPPPPLAVPPPPSSPTSGEASGSGGGMEQSTLIAISIAAAAGFTLIFFILVVLLLRSPRCQAMMGVKPSNVVRANWAPREVRDREPTSTEMPGRPMVGKVAPNQGGSGSNPGTNRSSGSGSGSGRCKTSPMGSPVTV